jgi:hypothetical protein
LPFQTDWSAGSTPLCALQWIHNTQLLIAPTDRQLLRNRLLRCTHRSTCGSCNRAPASQPATYGSSHPAIQTFDALRRLSGPEVSREHLLGLLWRHHASPRSTRNLLLLLLWRRLRSG